MSIPRSLLVVLLLLLTGVASGQAGDAKDPKGMVQNDPPEHWKIPPSPVVSPRDSLSRFTLEEGFEIELVASEPQIHDPVAIRFDADGRIWVVEMRGYMPDADGNDEDRPNGRISILEDADGDGFFETATPFLEGLVMPRAVGFVAGGILYAEPPNLWYVPETGKGVAGEKSLVDPRYAVGGNPEHQPNGLLTALDNWIYSAKAKHRYRLRGGAWQKERIEFRGQWGISQDDHGRLYYNSNSDQLRGDWVPPGTMARNAHLKWRTGYSARVAKNQRVFPARITPGVNRGYRKGVLTEDGRLARFTSASGPVIYRGDQFPPAYRGNGFVPEPAAFLIKRNILSEENGRVTSRFAYEDREFLTSTDERFRPVNLHNGPDGALYVVDFYRGIIQHRTYMTTFLRRQVDRRGLAEPVGLGRIYRVVWKGERRKAGPRMSSASSAELVTHLSHASGWWRDTAQRLLVERGDVSVVPALRALVLRSDAGSLARIHALWTLEGLGAFDWSLAFDLLGPQPEVAALPSAVEVAAIRVAESLIGTRSLGGTDLARLLETRYVSHPPEVCVQLAISLGSCPRESTHRWNGLLNLAAVSTGDLVLRDAILSGLEGEEERFAADLRARGFEDAKFFQAVDAAVEKAKKAKPPANAVTLIGAEKKLFDHGRSVYEGTCMICHEESGKGVPPLGPPLVPSEWVTGPPDRLVKIALYGLAGPVEVAGKVYAPPLIPELMPGLHDNDAFTDRDIAGALTYVRNSWGNQGSVILPEAVQKVRQAVGKRDPYTADELNKKP